MENNPKRFDPSNLLDEVRQAANNERFAAAQAQRRAITLERASWSVRGSVWKNASSTPLKIGKTYIVRRLWFSGERGVASIAKWTKKGWEFIYGNIPSASGGGGIEVLK